MLLYTQNPTSSGWLQSLLLLSRFHTLKKCDEIKYVYLIPSSNDTLHVIWFYLYVASLEKFREKFRVERLLLLHMEEALVHTKSGVLSLYLPSHFVYIK